MLYKVALACEFCNSILHNWRKKKECKKSWLRTIVIHNFSNRVYKILIFVSVELCKYHRIYHIWAIRALWSPTMTEIKQWVYFEEAQCC